MKKRQQDRKHEYHQKVMAAAMRINCLISVILRHCYWMTKPHSAAIRLVYFVSTCEFRFYTNSSISAEYKSVYKQMYELCISEIPFYLIATHIRASKSGEKCDIGTDSRRNKSDSLHISSPIALESSRHLRESEYLQVEHLWSTFWCNPKRQPDEAAIRAYLHNLMGSSHSFFF